MKSSFSLNKAVKLLTLLLLVCLTTYSNSQTINFTDLELKQHLINELCVDTNFDGYGDIDVDINNDNEIQVTEASNVLRLRLTGNNFPFTSIEDLNHFQNLNYLDVLQCHSISEFSNLVSDSIKTLIIGDCLSLKIIDISGLTGLTDVLRVEDMDTLDYINTQNGITPQMYSLFYTDHLRYACIDSNSTEYNETSWKMDTGTPTTENCIQLSTGIKNVKIDQYNAILLYPNPTKNILNIDFTDISYKDSKIQITNILGEVVFEKAATNRQEKISISHLNSGVYNIFIQSSSDYFAEKIIIQ